MSVGPTSSQLPDDDLAPGRDEDGVEPDDADDPRERLVRELRRVTDRLRTLDLGRLERAGQDGTSPATRAHGTAQALADLAADVVGRGSRPVPVLPAHAVADQVTVTARDLLAEGDVPAVRAGVERLVALRRSL